VPHIHVSGLIEVMFDAQSSVRLRQNQPVDLGTQGLAG